MSDLSLGKGESSPLPSPPMQSQAGIEDRMWGLESGQQSVILVPALAGCVITGKLPNLSEPVSPFL